MFVYHPTFHQATCKCILPGPTASTRPPIWFQSYMYHRRAILSSCRFNRLLGVQWLWVTNSRRQGSRNGRLDSASLSGLRTEIPGASQKWRDEAQENCHMKWILLCRAAHIRLAMKAADPPSAWPSSAFSTLSWSAPQTFDV